MSTIDNFHKALTLRIHGADTTHHPCLPTLIKDVSRDCGVGPVNSVSANPMLRCSYEGAVLAGGGVLLFPKVMALRCHSHAIHQVYLQSDLADIFLHHCCLWPGYRRMIT